jgi:hypothetical protein
LSNNNKEVKVEKEPAFVRAFKKDQKQQKEENVKCGDIRDRLMNRSKLLIVDVPMKDENGDFTIRCRGFTVKEQATVFEILNEFVTLVALQNNPGKANPKKILGRYVKGMETAKDLLGYPTGICLEPALTRKYWGEGMYTPDLPFYIIRYVIDHQSEAVKNATLFREKQRGDIPVSTVPNAGNDDSGLGKT